jgi:hypothetical protein
MATVNPVGADGRRGRRPPADPPSERAKPHAPRRASMDDAELAVASVESVGPDAVAIDFESPPDFDAQPGQFVKLIFCV